MTTQFRTRAFLAAPAALAAALFLASCDGGEASDPAPGSAEQPTAEQSAAEFNDADVMFARMMIPHHEQAVEMSRLAEDRAGEEVAALAAEIEAAQGPEIEQLRGMLDAWGVEPEGDGEHHGMSGMMTEEQMAELERAEGEAFDTLFLELMIAHHRGAVQMAEDQLENGVDPEAGELAREVVDAQEAEIEEMESMLGRGGGSGEDGAGQDGSGQGTEGDHGGH
ncbi:DUF305 domain-containing protein [Nocardiopsis sp. HUAS JQ3]|uniref:DUF305 domain-containing protein n=1 Tax=Nocardiopsis sp. HUAS JQ3 TaxID=3061629 RepID=UPI0023AA08DA|nr:DUF305 domain-containing protein [Nocardiopsis sp. HUAS JQ3]WDZ90328.1 DUF305 domain-containing protein [Nocardiopsis sp. HUAS JQ3]